MAIPDRCSSRSEAAGEPLGGSASPAPRWLLVEQPGPWGRDALRDARMPPGLRDSLRGMRRRLGVRVLLIRRVARRPDDGLRCFAVDARPGRERLWGTRVERIEDVPA